MPANVTLLPAEDDGDAETGSPLSGGGEEGGREGGEGGGRGKDKFEITGSDETPLCGRKLGKS